MARSKNTSTPKPKVEKTRKVLAAETEEIVVKLGTNEAVKEQAGAVLKDILGGESQLQQEIDELKRLNQQIQEENETLRKNVQVAEDNVSRQLATAERDKREAERHRLHFEGRIQELEKTNALNAVNDKKFSITAVQPQAAIAENITIPKTTFKAENILERQKIAVEPATPKLPEMSVKNVSIQAVQVFQPVASPLPTLTLTAEKRFAVQTIFHLSGIGALALTGEQAPFRAACYIYNLTDGGVRLLYTSKGELTETKIEYTINEYIPSLGPGLYRLSTLLTISSARNLTAHYQGPIVHVS